MMEIVGDLLITPKESERTLY